MARFTHLLLGSLALSVALAPLADGQAYTWKRLAGPSGGPGRVDGAGTAAQLSSPAGVAVDAAGNRYVADSGNNTIRKIDPAGNVTTLAGMAGTSGWVDGRRAEARFSQPAGLAVDAAGNVYVADEGNSRIRKIDPSGNVTTLAAGAGFNAPCGVAVDATGNVYVADTMNQLIRKVDPSGNVTTLAGDGTIGFADGAGSNARFRSPRGVAVDADGSVLVADTWNHRIRRVDPSGIVSTVAGDGVSAFADGPASTAHFSYPYAVAQDSTGRIVVSDYYNQRIRAIDLAGDVSTLAGDGVPDFVDGPAPAARFANPYGIAVDAAGAVFVADSGNHRVRVIGTAGLVSTLAGNGISQGFADGTATTARFAEPAGVAVDAAGNTYIADSFNSRIRKIDATGTTSTVAGDGNHGFADGLASTASFNDPAGVAVDALGNLFVADALNQRIRKIDTTGLVTTLAGTGDYGFADGPASAAQFASPRGVALDEAGNVYVADSANNRIRKIDTTGMVTTLAGDGTSGYVDGPSSTARFNFPNAVTVDASGNVYVADTYNNRTRKIDALGVVTTYSGYSSPTGVALDAAGNLWQTNLTHRIVRTGAGTGSTTVFGGNGSPGATDGSGTAASFNKPWGVAVDPVSGAVIVADTYNHCVRTGVPALADVATIDASTGPRFTPRQLDTAPQTATSWTWEVVRRPAGSTAQLSSPAVRNPTFTPDVEDVFTFRLAARDASGMTSITLVSLTATSCAPAAPVITRTAGSNPSCPGASVTLDAGDGYASYLWSTGATTRTITVAPTVTTTYTVQVTAGTCPDWSPAASYQLVTGALSSVELAPDSSQAVCDTETGATLTAVPNGGGVSTRQWGYRTTAGGTITAIAGQVGDSYQVTGSHFPAPGIYYVVCTLTPACGPVTTSNEVLLLVYACPPVPANLTFRRLAGPAGGAGYEDGPGTTARLSNPGSVAVDSTGNRYVADSGNHTIRKIDAAGNVTTLAGRAGTPGYADGAGGAARFNGPQGITVDGAGDLVVADAYNQRIRKIDADGNVTTLAGNGSYGFADGAAFVAKFAFPQGVVVDASGNVYVADSSNHRIRKIDASGNVTTVAGAGAGGFADGPGATAMFNSPRGIAVAGSADLYVADASNNRIRRIDPAGNVTTFAGTGAQGFTDGAASVARFSGPMGVAVDGNGNVYVADRYNRRLRRIDTSGTVSTVAGGAASGYADGPASTARFSGPQGVAVEASGVLYVADPENNRIRKVDTGGNVTTLVWNGGPTRGFVDGPATTARFGGPSGVAVSMFGDVFVADGGNARIRRVDLAGSVTTYAGSSYGYADGSASLARFQSPTDVAVDRAGNLFVADSAASRIRKVDASGNVTTLAGDGSSGFADGPGSAARFNGPYGVTVDGSGNVFVADWNNNRIRKIDPAGYVTTLAGTGTYGYADGPAATAQFQSPTGVFADSTGNVFVAEVNGRRIRKVDASGTVTTVASGLNSPARVVVDLQGNAYVATTSSSAIVRVASGTGAITTLGGYGTPGSFEGTGTAAGFYNPWGIALDPFTGTLFVADTANDAIRVGEATLPDVATIDAASAPVGQARQLDTSPQTATTWTWELVRRPPGSTAELSSTTVRNPTFTPDVPDLYVFRLTAANAVGTRSGTLVSLAAWVPPTAAVSGDATVCAGAPANLTVVLTGTAPWSLTWSDGFVQSGIAASPAVRVVTPPSTTTFALSAVSDANGAGSVSGTATVTVAGTAPSATITAPTATWPGQTGLVASVPDAGAGAAYVWTVSGGTLVSGQGTASITFDPTAAGVTTLSVTVTNSQGCSLSGTRRVTVLPKPPASRLTFTHWAGPGDGGFGYEDGPASTARFGTLYDAARDASGNTFIADAGNHTIRRLSPSGEVTTVAGTAGERGYADGVRAAARFSGPRGIALVDGFLYVSDSGNSVVRRIGPDGTVATLAGTAGSSGFADGTGSAATFSTPERISVGPDGNLYVADSGSHTIRRVTPAGVVTTVAGTPGTSGSSDGPAASAALAGPLAAVLDDSGNLWIGDSGNHLLRKLGPDGNVTTMAGATTLISSVDGVGSSAGFSSLSDLELDGSGGLWVADGLTGGRLRRVDADASVTTVAGSSQSGYLDGVGSAAIFLGTSGLAPDGAGNVVVTETYNANLRLVTPGGVVTTLAGRGVPRDAVDGTGPAAHFYNSAGLAVSPAGDLFVADSSTVRRVTPGAGVGTVTTLAGLAGTSGNVDGVGTAARFGQAWGLAAAADGTIWVTDNTYHSVRRIAPDGTVTTVAGSGSSGTADGTGGAARFYSPRGIAIDLDGNAVVADYRNHAIRRVTPSGVVTTIAGLKGTSGSADGVGTAARFYNPIGVAVDGNGSIWVVDESSYTLRRVDPDGTVTTIAGVAGESGSVDGVGTGARFRRPYALAASADGALWVAELSALRRAAPDGTVTTVAGSGSRYGNVAGTAGEALFTGNWGLALDGAGNVFFDDSSAHAIRIGTPAPPDTATIDLPTGLVGETRSLGVAPSSAVSWQWEVVRRPTGSTAQLSSSSVAAPTFTPDVADDYVFRLTATGVSGARSITLVSLNTFTACSTPATPAPTNDGPVCEGGTLQLSTAYVPGGTYSWSGPDGFTSTAMLPTRSGVTASMAGGYSVTVTVGTCVSAPGTTIVVVNPAPVVPTISTPATVVPNTTFEASVENRAGRTYVWTVIGGTLVSGQGTAQVTVKPTWASPVTLKVVETSASGCASPEAMTNVTVALPEGSAAFYTLTPCRAVNTRRADFPQGLGAPSIGAAGAADRVLPLTSGTCGIPATARAVALNVTVADTQGAGYLTLYPGNGTAPATSTINFAAGQVKANNVFQPLATDGSGSIKVKSGSTGPLNVLIDVVGYFE